MFCRNCGKGLVATPDKTCVSCGANAVKATSFCRYCGNATTAKDITCPKCGVSIRILAKSGEASNKEGQGRFTTTKTVLKILAAVTFVSLYVMFTLPPKAVRPLQAAASDLVLSTTGYTAFPLNSLSATPPTIPPLQGHGETYVIAGVTVNTTKQLTIYSIYKNTTTYNATGAVRSEDVTGNSTFQSSNDQIATVTSGGLVQAVARGSANITASYTAAPGSANRTAASEGKVPITVTVTVPVTVK